MIADLNPAMMEPMDWGSGLGLFVGARGCGGDPRVEEEPFLLARVGAGGIPVLYFPATGMAGQDL